MRLARFEHRPGVHCGSTALSDALRARGLDLSEPMCFGVGAGLGFYYLTGASLSPTHMFHGRYGPLEATACEVLGAPLVERTEDDPARAWRGVADALERGLAPVLSCDVRYLPYYRTETSFNGHRVAVAGWDEERKVAFLADTERPGLQETPLDALDRARASEGPPVGYSGRLWMEIDAPPSPRPMRDVVADAVKRQATHMLLESAEFIGLPALDRFAAELPDWPRTCAGEADRAWSFRFGYQVIEKRGTGGGLFRGLYARFLAEAEHHLPQLASMRARERMEALSAGWSRLGASFRELSDAPGAGVPPAVAELARQLARDERRFYEDAAAYLP